MNKILNYILPHDYSFYILNPENSKDFKYSKQARQKNIQNKSSRKLNGADYENTSTDEIKKIITARQGTIFINSLILSGVIVALLILTGLLSGFDWFKYAVCLLIYPSAAYIIYNVLNRNYYSIFMHYSIDGSKQIFYDSLLDSLYELSGAKSIWHVDRITPNKKMNSLGGAREIYHRHIVKTGRILPAFIKTNVNVWSLELRNARLFFFPDYIVLENRKRYSVLDYETLSIEYIEKPYYETDANPDDAKITGTTWLHPKKGGGPDKRFRNNPKISILLYGELKITSSAGDLLHLQISNFKTAYLFYKFISQHAMRCSEQRYHEPENTQKKQKSKKTYQEEEKSSGYQRSDIKHDLRNEVEKAYLVLGLSVGAPLSEIRTAYYLMAKKYHPDLVSNKKLMKESEEKMKEINKAYERLRQ